MRIRYLQPDDEQFMDETERFMTAMNKTYFTQFNRIKKKYGPKVASEVAEEARKDVLRTIGW